MHYEDIRNQWRTLTKDIGIDICMPDTRVNKNLLGTFISDIVLQILSFVAQNERETIRKRQAEGIVAAKARGVRFGRCEKPLPDDFPALAEARRAQRMNLQKVLRRCEISESTFCRRMHNI